MLYQLTAMARTFDGAGGGITIILVAIGVVTRPKPARFAEHTSIPLLNDMD